MKNFIKINRALVAKKKVLTFLLALVVGAGTLFAESGTCGANVTWDLTDGVLTISGTGDMTDFTYESPAPWYDIRESINTVVINSGVTTIGERAFELCENVTTVTIPNGITKIGDSAIRGTKITSITIPTSVTYIGSGVFDVCRKLTSVFIPAGVTFMGSWVFDGCDDLTAIDVDAANENYCSVDGVLFNKEKTLLIQYPRSKTGTTYTIPNSVEWIGMDAFSGCDKLTSVKIPDGVEAIGFRVFSFCTGLTSITCEAITPPTCGDNCFYRVDKTIPLYVPKGKVEAYKDPSAYGWKDFNNIQEIGGGTGIEQVTNDQSQMTNGKSFSNGQLLILRDGKTFTVTGQMVK